MFLTVIASRRLAQPSTTSDHISALTHPSRSSNPLPSGVAGFAAVFEDGAGDPLPPVLATEAAPQMPAWLLALDRLARSGPFDDAAALLTPAAELALLQSEPKASPPLLDDAAFGAGLPSDAADVDDAYEGAIPGRWNADDDEVALGNVWFGVSGTEVK